MMGQKQIRNLERGDVVVIAGAGTPTPTKVVVVELDVLEYGDDRRGGRPSFSKYAVTVLGMDGKRGVLTGHGRALVAVAP